MDSPVLHTVGAGQDEVVGIPHNRAAGAPRKVPVPSVQSSRHC